MAETSIGQNATNFRRKAAELAKERLFLNTYTNAIAVMEMFRPSEEMEIEGRSYNWAEALAEDKIDSYDDFNAVKRVAEIPITRGRGSSPYNGRPSTFTFYLHGTDEMDTGILGDITQVYDGGGTETIIFKNDGTIFTHWGHATLSSTSHRFDDSKVEELNDWLEGILNGPRADRLIEYGTLALKHLPEIAPQLVL